MTNMESHKVTISVNQMISKREPSDTSIFILFGNSETLVRELLHIYKNMTATSSKPRRSILLIAFHVDENPLEQSLKQLSKNVNLSNSHFFLALPSGKDFNWLQIITLQGQTQVVINQLRFSQNKCVIEEYNLQKLNVTSIALSWYTMNDISGCDESGMHCKSSQGPIPEVMSYVARISNFTLHNFIDPNGDWGVFPKKGPYSLSGKWGGVMGEVGYELFLTD